MFYTTSGVFLTFNVMAGSADNAIPNQLLITNSYKYYQYKNFHGHFWTGTFSGFPLAIIYRVLIKIFTFFSVELPVQAFSFNATNHQRTIHSDTVGEFSSLTLLFVSYGFHYMVYEALILM